MPISLLPGGERAVGNWIIRGVKYWKAAVSFALKGNDALTLADTAAMVSLLAESKEVMIVLQTRMIFIKKYG